MVINLQKISYTSMMTVSLDEFTAFNFFKLSVFVYPLKEEMRFIWNTNYNEIEKRRIRDAQRKRIIRTVASIQSHIIK